ncbi:MAG: peptide MFS transporter [Deltaproteobacteria bacterium]|nr:peptide MFS transporter [Deltaproteobacteria bacterium]
MTHQPFPRSFWTANTTELFERGAYYSVASFIVIYLGQLGLGDYWPSTLNGFLWSIVYFLPILSGTIADQVGFRRALVAAFLLLCSGYFLMGVPVWFGGQTLSPSVGSEVTATAAAVVPVVLGMLLIGLGGSVVKPCISGTVQKTHRGRATLAFAIFYMVINIGSLFGRGVSFYVRTHSMLANIFAVGTGCAAMALLVVLFAYRDPESEAGYVAGPPKPKRSIPRILADMVLVLRNPRFSLFLLVSSGFWFLYSQVYNVLPLYLKKVVETDPAVDIYTMANPLVIVCFQLLVTHLFGKMRPIRSIVVGTVIIGLSMAVNIIPALAGSVRTPFLDLLPVGASLIVLSVALVAFGELFTSARMFEYIGALAPKGQEGLFLGYANLPTAIGALIGGPAGAAIFNEVMCTGATKRPDGLLELDPTWNSAGWLILMTIGLLSALSMWLYNRWIEAR